jgi:carbonic anhydrase
MTQDLIKGAERFKKQQYAREDGVMPGLAEEGQDPDYFIISCIDSRCNPATIFGAPPGTFFAHKAMGAIVRPYKQGTALAAALQFAINYNNVKTVIVLGHTECGAMKALVENIDDEEISSFISVAKQALKTAEGCCDNHADVLKCTEREAILESVKNLKDYPSVRAALEKGTIDVKAWQFDIRAGDIYEYDEGKQAFTALTA